MLVFVGHSEDLMIVFEYTRQHKRYISGIDVDTAAKTESLRVQLNALEKSMTKLSGMLEIIRRVVERLLHYHRVHQHRAGKGRSRLSRRLSAIIIII